VVELPFPRSTFNGFRHQDKFDNLYGLPPESLVDCDSSAPTDVMVAGKGRW